MLPRGVDQFTAFTTNFEQKTSLQRQEPQGTSTPLDAEALIEAEEEEEDETCKKQSYSGSHHTSTSSYFSSGIFVTTADKQQPPEHQQASPPNYKNIFHCVFRI